MERIREEFGKYRLIFETELQGNILRYWLDRCYDQTGRRFYGAVDLDGRPVEGAGISCVLQSRILWTFSAASIFYKDPGYADMAGKSFEALQKGFSDSQYGGYYMEINPDNTISSEIKHTYIQAFVIYALCKYYEFNPSAGLLSAIHSLFDLLENTARDKNNPGYFEAFTRDWKIYGENRMADNNEPKSMNTHLHILEAYAQLCKIRSDKYLKDRLEAMIRLFLEKIVRPDGHLGIFFDEKFNESRASGGTCSFGHEIEASWLLVEAAEILGNQKILEKVKRVSLQLASLIEREGVDKDGGLFLESTRYGSHLRTNKHWWLQAESLVGFMNAFQLTGNLEYWSVVKRCWDFIDNHVIDHRRGEWFTKVNRLGKPFLEETEDDPSPYYRNDRKIDPWKCPYHNGRAMLELIRRIDTMIQNPGLI
ncbi:MAG TPA: AGE family epimerase/isomerase [Cyclobacteriaceae bacterium]|nr:AGE family epimerase/isomerase [Cyclobacteriaceae bacterium]